MAAHVPVDSIQDDLFALIRLNASSENLAIAGDAFLVAVWLWKRVESVTDGSKSGELA